MIMLAGARETLRFVVGRGEGEMSSVSFDLRRRRFEREKTRSTTADTRIQISIE